MAAQDLSSNLINPAQRNLAGPIDALMIEKFDGRVHMHEQKASITSGLFDFMPLVGTDTMSNAAMGDPSLQPVIRGVEPLGGEIEVGDQIVQVKQPIIARVTMPMLSQVQDRLSIKSRTPMNFGRRIAKAIDEILLLMCVKSAMKATGAGEVSDMPGGVNEQLAAAGDELDATDLELGILSLAQKLAEQEVEQGDGKCYLAPAQYFTLLKNDKLTSVDYSAGNGNYAAAFLTQSAGMPLVMTNRLTQAADDGSDVKKNGYLMGANYTTSADEALAVALFCMAESIMVAQSIPLTSDVYWDKRLLCWFIDSYLAFGAAPDRPDKTAVLRKTT